MAPAAAVIACALGLLGRSHTIAPIQLVAVRPAHASANVEAFVTEGEHVIYLVTSSETFREAQQDPWTSAHLEGCRKIASVIVHEEWHLRFGADERGAYLAQLTILQALGARPETLTLVRRSMSAAIEGAARRGAATQVAGRVGNNRSTSPR